MRETDAAAATTRREPAVALAGVTIAFRLADEAIYTAVECASDRKSVV